MRRLYSKCCLAPPSETSLGAHREFNRKLWLWSYSLLSCILFNPSIRSPIGVANRNAFIIDSKSTEWWLFYRHLFKCGCAFLTGLSLEDLFLWAKRSWDDLACTRKGVDPLSYTVRSGGQARSLAYGGHVIFDLVDILPDHINANDRKRVKELSYDHLVIERVVSYLAKRLLRD